MTDDEIIRGATFTAAERERDSLDHAREVMRRNCTCGSGLHPRRCIAHPLAYDAHVTEINMQIEEGERIERDTAEQIAAWLDRRDESGARAGTTADDYLHNVARDIRTGAWKPAPSGGVALPHAKGEK